MYYVRKQVPGLLPHEKGPMVEMFQTYEEAQTFVASHQDRKSLYVASE